MTAVAPLLALLLAAAAPPAGGGAAPADAAATERRSVAAVLDAARAQLGAGQPVATTGMLLRAARHERLRGDERREIAALLLQAAEAFARSEERKAAAVAADAAAALDDGAAAAAAPHLLAWARQMATQDPAAARGLAERAARLDPRNEEAVELVARLRGRDTFFAGHAILAGGVGCAALAAASFVWGFDAERELRSAVHERAEVDALLLRRTGAALIAWPSAALAAVGTGLGLALVMAHEPAPEPVLPPPLPALPELLP